MTEAQFKKLEAISSEGSFSKLIENRKQEIPSETPKVSRLGAHNELLKRLELTFSSKVNDREKSSPPTASAPKSSNEVVK